MALSFAADIRPLFRGEDIDCMQGMGIDLGEAAWMCVRESAQSVYERLADGSMPPDDAWPVEKVSLFKSWMDTGCPA